MREWLNPWNPFNSAKVLLWRNHLEGCANEDYLPPVTVDIDPSNRCNYDCRFCNAYDMITGSKKDMPEDHMLKLADFLKEWGVNSACIAGGGEPYMNKGMCGLIERMHENGLENGIITNGSLLTYLDIKIMAKTCLWVGFSIDAYTPETYAKVKGIKNGDLIYKVIENIKQLVKESENTKCSVAFKYLLMPDNQYEIYEAVKLAKEIGVRDFHLRPVGWDNLTKTKGKEDYNYNLKAIDKQIKEGQKLETKDFRVFGIRHKFNSDFTRKVNFKRCWAIPILPTFGADGNVHTCFDMRGRKDLILCRHEPDPSEILNVWNTEYHKKMVRDINVNDCPRCTFGSYNEIVEKVIIEDGFCRNFP
jgi:MoaA/NifB/PqqE/SkfB family radical SAM enzyme